MLWPHSSSQGAVRDLGLPVLHLLHTLHWAETHPHLMSGWSRSSNCFQCNSFLVTDYVWYCLHLLQPLARTNCPSLHDSSGEVWASFSFFSMELEILLTHDLKNRSQCSSSWGSLGPPPPSRLSTSTPPSSFQQLWGPFCLTKLDVEFVKWFLNRLSYQRKTRKSRQSTSHQNQ